MGGSQRTFISGEQSKKLLSEGHLNICSRLRKKTVFSGQKNICRIRTHLTPGQYFYIQEDKVDEKGDNSEACELEAAMKADDEATRKAEEETAPKTETGSKYCFRLLCEHDQVRFLHMLCLVIVLSYSMKIGLS